MRDVVVVVEPSIDVQQIAREIAKAHVALQDCEHQLDVAEKKTEGLREQQRRHRVEIGRLLVEAKRGIKHGGWLPYLEKLGIDQQRASEWMRLAGHVETKVPEYANSGDLPKTVMADAGIDTKPRRTAPRDEQPDPPDADEDNAYPQDDTQSEIERRAFDVDRELSRWHQKIVAFAEVCPAAARKQIAHELRQMAQTIESIKG